MLTTFVLCFGFSGLACAGAFLASYAAENGLPLDLSDFAPAPRASAPLAVFEPPAPSAPVWCESARRWRDPVTLRFAKAPAC